MKKSSLAEKLNKVLKHKHGWDVELECASCGKVGVPDYNGWKPGRPAVRGGKPTIYAELTCPECSKSLKDEAAEELSGQFSEIPVDSRAKRYLYYFIFVSIAVFSVALALSFIIGPVSIVLMAVVLPGIHLMNYKIHSIRHSCECGKADYIFMGMLGRAYCYRCRTCGKLLKLRD